MSEPVDPQALADAAAALPAGDAGAAHALGRRLLQAGEAARALPLLKRAAQLDGARAEHWLGYAEGLIAADRPEDALMLIARLTGAAYPDETRAKLVAAALLKLGQALVEQGRAAEAEALLSRALALAPDDPDAAAALGWAMSRMGRHAEAEAPYRQALGLAPDRAALWTNLGATLAELNREREAEACYRQALTLEPGNRAALANLGALLRAQGRVEEARAPAAAASRAETVVPALLALRPVSASTADIAAQRAAYAQGLEALRARTQPLAYAGETFGLPSFYLAYHGLDDRPLMEATAAALRASVADLDYVSPNAARRHGGGRIRIAIVSDNLGAHTIGHLYKGIVQGLDRARFEVVAVHGAHSRRDAFRDSLDAAADGALALSGGLADQRGQIEALAPDVVFYPDVGMTAPSYFLAHARLAPVQATAWGHPDTTGLATLDHFISTEMFEPAGAEACYTERLVRLPRIPCRLEPPPPARAMSREQLGWPARGTLYGCPQTLFKLHPEFDAVLAAITEDDPDGHIVLPAADQPAWTQALLARWRAHWPILLERALWTPRVAPEVFRAQLAEIDVLIDPLHFGSGYTFYQAMAEGAPMVTCPGAFARGRAVAGAYRQMGAGGELVAESPAALAALALRLGADPAERARLRAELRAAARANLFSDAAAVRQLGDFFASAVAEARGG